MDITMSKINYGDEAAGESRSLELWGALDEDWTVYFRVALRPGLPIAEIRVFPTAADTAPRDGWNGDSDAVPPLGVPMRKLRSVTSKDVQAAVEAFLTTDDPIAGEAMKAANAPLVSLLDRSDTPDDLTSPQRLALIARDYVELVKGGDPYPNRTLAELWDRTPAQITSDIYNARHRHQLITKAAGQGQAGGDLTKKAQGIIERLERNRDA